MDVLPRDHLASLVKAFLHEDVGRGDVTTLAVVPSEARLDARIEAREPAVVAGLEVARACFEEIAAGSLEWTTAVSEGQEVAADDTLVRMAGSARSILTAERTALNLLARLSGVASLTRSFVERIDGTAARIVDTRKTTPGLRVLEKYAVRVGRGANHRFGLDDGVLIKDNHIAVAGSVAEAVTRARRSVPHGMKVEVEIVDLDQLDEALAGGADAILLDNMDPEMVRTAVARAGGKVILEASGGIDLDNVREFALAGADLISIGALTHSARSIDVSLEVGW